jgi:hypothetical protein
MGVLDLKDDAGGASPRPARALVNLPRAGRGTWPRTQQTRVRQLAEASDHRAGDQAATYVRALPSHWLPGYG